MTRKTDAVRPARKTIVRRSRAKAETPAVVPSTLRRDLGQQASRFALLTAIGLAAAGAGSLATPDEAMAQCVADAANISCTSGSTANNGGRQFQRSSTDQVRLTIEPDSIIGGVGFSVENTDAGGVGATNHGVLRVDAGAVPTAGGSAALNLTANGGPLTNSGAGDIINEGTGEGLRADQTGAGLIDLNVGGDVRAVGDSAIHATMGAAGTGMTIVTHGAVEAGGLAGIWAESTAADGDISVTANGAVRGDTAGILANQGGTSAGDVSVTANGAVEGGVIGIEATTFGSGAVTVRASGPVRSGTGQGIRTFAGGGAVDIASGEVTSGGTGISVTGFGGASPETVRVNTTGPITSTNGSGIDATSAGTMDTVVTGNISAGQDGLNLGAGFADSGGAGDLVASVDGSVTAGAFGARLYNEGDGAIDVTVAGDVNAGETGVSASAEGGITLSLGNVTGGTAGIRTRGREATSGDINVTVAGDVVAQAGRGFESIQDGTGATDFVTAGNVTGTGGSAIHVHHTATDGGDIDIDVGGDVTATGTDADGAPADGVEATTNGLSSDITIRTRGGVQADGYGVIAGIAAGATSVGDLSVTTEGDVSAALGGIAAQNAGTGRTDVVANGDVTAGSETGILVSGSTVTVRAAGDVSGGFHGVQARLTPGSTGSIDIEVDGDVTGAVQGVNIFNSGAGGTRIDVEGSITAGSSGVSIASGPEGGDVNARVGGSIQADNGVSIDSVATQSDILITTEGNVSATSNGIRVARQAGQGDTTVQASGDISADVGINIDQGGGAGDVSITGSGTITGTTGAGIRIANNVGSISLDVANVTGATNAIAFVDPDADSISITGSGDIIAQDGYAIRIEEVGPGGVSIDRTGLIQSDGGDAIIVVDATPDGGDILVSVQDVVARGSGADGIVTVSRSDEANISIQTSGDVRADGYGIAAAIDNDDATGDIFMRLGGAVEGSEGGIDVLSRSAGVDIASTGSVTSAQTAVAVRADGPIRIDLEGPVTGSTGLRVRREANGNSGNVVRTGAVTATDGRGIDFLNDGDRTTLVEARGPISSTNGDGVNVLNNANGGDVTVIANSVTATGGDNVEGRAADGIRVASEAGGANISITANGDVRTSEDGTGIVARHIVANASGAISITARGDVYGGVGIDAVTDSTGAMTIVTEGQVTGADAEGIYAETHGALDVVVNGHVTGYSAGVVLIGGEETGGDVTLTGAGGVTALAGNAVEARNDGDGGVTIDLSGDVVATDGSGYVVRALQSDNEDVSVTTGNVTAEDGVGVDVRMAATNADIDITTNGDIIAGSQGIYAAMGAAAEGNINITANGSTEGFTGIHADTDGIGDINVIANGPVRGTVNAGILATGRRAVNVAVNGAVTGATSGLVVITGEAGVDADVTVTGTGSLVGQGGSALAIGSTGTGDVTVDIAGTLTSNAGHGVAIGNTAEGGDIRVRTGAISATQSGVAIQSNANAGELVIDIDGDIDAGSQGIIAAQLSSTSEADIDITARGDIRANSGIVAEHRGAGDIAVEVLGSIFSDNGAIIADGKGAVTIAVAGDIVSEGRGISIGGGVDTDGDIDVTIGGTLTAGNGEGLFINNAGEGRVSVDVAGAIIAEGYGVLIQSDDQNGGDVNVSVSDVTAGETGVYVNYGSPTASIAVEANGDIVSGSHGIFAALNNDDAQGDVTVIARGNVSGDDGIFAGTAGMGAVFLRADGDVSGLSTGLVAQGRGAVTIEANGTVSGRVFGATAAGGRAGETADIRVVGAGGFQASEGNALRVLNNGWGDIIVDIAGDTSATGGTGVLILDNAAGGDVEVTLGGARGHATALVPETYGVDMRLATLTGDARLRVAGDAFGSTGGILAGLAGATATGDVTIVTEGDVAGGFGIAAFNNGFGTLSVTAEGDVTAETGQGIEAVGGGAVDLTVNGQVTAAEIGMLVIGGQTAGAGDIVVSGTGGVSSATDHAVVINNLGTGGIQYDLSGPLSSVGGDGLLIRDLEVGGDITVVTGDVTALDGFGLNIVSNSRDADLDVTVEGAITAGLTGILALRDENTPAATGDISINATGPIVAGTGILARNVGSGSTTVVVNGAVQANDGSGVVAEAENGDVSVEAGTVTATGANNTGVSARRVGQGLGSVSVDVTSARGARGILASNDGDGDVTVTAASTTGTVEEGVVAQKMGAGTGDVSVTVGSATGRRGVLANNLGTGATRVVSGGTITGAVEEGVFAASAGAGGVVVDVNDVTGGTLGVRTSNSGSGATEIDISGTVTGASAAVLATSTANQAVRITNSGTIRNTANRSSDLALQANGGQIDVANSGSLLGRLVLQGNITSTVNSGAWNSINGVSQFQGGDDRLSNTASGVITGGVNGSTAETTVWAGLESFTNSGTLDLGDGGTGDLIATSANTMLAATSTLQVDIAGASLSDAFRTTGTLSIAAGAQLEVNFIQPLVVGARYVVAEALQGLDGEFVFQDRLVSAFLGLRDGYTDTEAYVELAQLRAFEEAGDTPNRRETGRGVDSLDEDNPLHEAILLLPDDGAARAAFDQLSGEIHPAMRRAMVDESRLSREAVLERLEGDGDGGVWAHGLYGRGRVAADGNATRADRDTGGVIFGADGSIAPGVTIGAAGGWVDSDIGLQRRNSDGTARNVHAMGYAGFRMDRWSLRGGVGYSWTSVETDRSVAFPGVTDRLRAEYDGSVMQAFLEAGYRVPTNGGYVEPFVNLTTIHANTDGFRETGGVARIEGEGVRDDLHLSTLGFRVQTAQPGAFSARGMFGVRHMDGDLAQAGQHRFPGGGVFTILTSPHDDIAAVATFEADWQLTPWLSLGAVFDGAKGEDGGDHAITGRLKMAF